MSTPSPEKPLSAEKAAARARISAAGDELVALSRSIHAEPELAFAEHRSAEKVAVAMERAGFDVTRGVCDLPTALSATYGGGDLVVALCAEYDALPEIGHACGHNVIAASSVGAALALASVADELGITVKLLGTPAEESGGGKQLMLDRGAFDDVAVAMMAHPAPVDLHMPGGLSTKASGHFEIVYTGLEAHASAAPHTGINALDAVTVAQTALGLLRQHMVPGGQFHGIVQEGGLRPNIVPARTKLAYYLRADTLADMHRLEARVRDCFAAGALATGATMEMTRTSPDYAEMRNDPWLADVYTANLAVTGREAFPVPPEFRGGSTDMGNVSHALPGIHPVIGIDPAGFSMPHTPAFAAAAATPEADKGVIDAAAALAWTAIDLALDDARRAGVLEALAVRRAD
ncbi:amidohydrolase [Planobispora longispora]|uniref:Peptidase M20 domain-containing protein 2 n=1 Tax=Planobispora longispora TaxID=28887 RepID=A0A8J3RN13_9ACTN|nr:amidohydrolase [Planobispora longispora]BFE82768.1 M20 family metallopeptidase [Planobispora longispora]GIH78000.1 amidohydrolase [Planobispora longispora]